MVNVVNLEQFKDIKLEIRYKKGKETIKAVIPRVSSRFTFMFKSHKALMFDVVKLYQNSVDNETKKINLEAFNFELCSLLGNHFDIIVDIISKMLCYYIGDFCTTKWVDENLSDEIKIQLLTALIQSTTASNNNEQFIESTQKATLGSKKKVTQSLAKKT
jgi:hypothetical protein